MVEAINVSPQLVERSGRHAGRIHEVPYGEHVIGRAPDVSVQLDHEDVSRRHARLEVGVDGVLLEDLDSKNGIFVAGTRVEGVVQLGHGDHFTIGDIAIEVVHPASKIQRMLERAGETTVTRPRGAPTQPRARAEGILLPVVGVVVFGILVALMLLM